MAYAGENMNSRAHNGSAENPVENQENAVVIEATGLKKSFKTSDGVLDVLNGVNLKIRSGEMVSVVGESGAGKSTLLHILGGLDRSSGGGLKVCGRSYSEMDDDELAEFRNQNIGFVFQFHHLMADFSAIENVMIPLLIRGDNPTESREKASYLLESMGLSGRKTHRPGKLSEVNSNVLQSQGLSQQIRRSFLRMSRAAISMRRQRLPCMIHCSN